MDPYYQHVRHIIRQKATRVGGIPFLTVPQGIAIMGLLGLGTVMQLPLLVTALLGVMGFVTLYIYQGEFVILIVARILKAAVLVQTGHAPIVEIGHYWHDLARQEQASRSAAVVYQAEGVQMVSDVGGRQAGGG
jgi:hypothetical protein